MSDFFRRHSLFLTSLLLLASCFQLMSLSISNPEIPRTGARVVTSALYPLEKFYHEASESLKYLWSHYLWLLEVEEERNELVDRLKELEAQNSRLMEYESENQRLRTLLQFSERTEYSGVVAAVVGRDPSNWAKTITIDRGSSDGIRTGLAVVDGHAIVGQTVAVSSRSSQVLLLTDHTSSIAAIVQNSRVAGVAEGGLQMDLLRLRYVEKVRGVEVNTGDRVIASGLDGVFPKGTLIGVVQRVESHAPGLFQYIEVEPSVEIKRLENVMIIVPAKAPSQSSTKRTSVVEKGVKGD